MGAVQIEAEQLSFSYDKDSLVLDNISFLIKEKEAVGLIGANGAGKSTLLKLLVGLKNGYEGKLYAADIPVEDIYLNQVREKMGYVFQDSDNQLFMSTVEEDVAFGPRNYGLAEEEVQKRVSDALKSVKIEHLKEKQIYKMSGGEKKLAAIATVLSMRPQVILMDEPSAALDPKNRRNLIRILNQMEQTKLIASHDLDFIWDTCGRVLLLSDGKLKADGAAKEILQNEDLLAECGLELPLSLQRRSGEI